MQENGKSAMTYEGERLCEVPSEACGGAAAHARLRLMVGRGERSVGQLVVSLLSLFLALFMQPFIH